MVIAPSRPRKPRLALTSPQRKSASSTRMENSNTNFDLLYHQLMGERDRIRASMKTPTPSPEHVGIEIFAAWADGKLERVDVEREIRATHRQSDCRICRDNLEYYAARRARWSAARQ